MQQIRDFVQPVKERLRGKGGMKFIQCFPK
jgi:hypothetical protein